MSMIQPTDTDDTEYPVKRQETKSFIPLMIYCLILALAYTQATEYERVAYRNVFRGGFIGIVLYFLYTKIFMEGNLILGFFFLIVAGTVTIIGTSDPYR